MKNVQFNCCYRNSLVTLTRAALFQSNKNEPQCELSSLSTVQK